LGAAIHSISHASVSDRPNTVYLLFATLSYAKSHRNRGTNLRKMASYGKGRLRYSIILSTASDLM